MLDDEFTPSVEQQMRMEDVGTRFQHCTELLDFWGNGLQVLQDMPEHRRTERSKKMLAQLIPAVDLLKTFLTNTRGEYDEYFYAKTINRLPRDAQEIKDECKSS